ncbi:LamG-like jellyroll fold domain-containing protein [Microbacterium invictum]|uniref:LamG-like jellyroll fold domain-containing protein n=1 Tax=Microbacterium invictum TaxID=515415 RepID=A0ABZ0VF82_9MICO|nr:LamG-like jellyroll fold domain-containing protein [Microbacterium invictum]WQB72104.1 LamG-like jellyroll fold domain-containing protein [Microbacterium invictum]
MRLPAESVERLNVGASTNQVTVAAWVYMTDSSTGVIAGIWPETATDPRRSYALFYDLGLYGGDERSNFHVSKHGGATAGYPYNRDYSASGQVFQRRTWQLHVGTYDGQQAVSYLDGTSVPIPRFTDNKRQTYAKNPYIYREGLNAEPADFTVGAVQLASGPGNFGQGTIAKLRVWDVALTPEQVSALHAAESRLLTRSG